MVLLIVSCVLLGLALLGALFNAITALLIRPVPPAPECRSWPGITVLKPLHGGEPALEHNLRALFDQDYPGPVRIIFGTRNSDDPALAAVDRLRAGYPLADVDLVVSDRRWGANNKLSNLANMDAVEERRDGGRHPIVVIGDSDVDWPRDTLRRLAAALAEPDMALASCLHVGRGDAGFWSRLAAMDISYRFMPSVLFGVALGLARPTLGPTMAFTRDALDRIGGFAAFGDVLADDYEIGAAIRGLDRRSVLPPFYIVHGCSEASLSALAGHELRWTVTIFRIDPAGFAGSFVLHTLPLALFGSVAAGFSSLSVAVLAVAFASRGLVKMRMDRASGTVSGPIWLLPIRDLLSFALFCATFFMHKVDWRGSRFRVTRDGKLHMR